MSLATDNPFETRLVEFENQFLNTTHLIGSIIVYNFRNSLQYLAVASVIFGVLSCFLPCFLCKVTKYILLTPCRLLQCIICQKRKAKFNKLDKLDKLDKVGLTEIDDKKQKLIAV
jgi:hypothetical protein